MALQKLPINWVNLLTVYFIVRTNTTQNLQSSQNFAKFRARANFEFLRFVKTKPEARTRAHTLVGGVQVVRAPGFGVRKFSARFLIEAKILQKFALAPISSFCAL